jgi:hypothetical protein
MPNSLADALSVSVNRPADQLPAFLLTEILDQGLGKRDVQLRQSPAHGNDLLSRLGCRNPFIAHGKPPLMKSRCAFVDRNLTADQSR